jgi:hypothetical protein
MKLKGNVKAFSTEEIVFKIERCNNEKRNKSDPCHPEEEIDKFIYDLEVQSFAF